MQPLLTVDQLQRLLADPDAVEACSVANGNADPWLTVDLESGTPDPTAQSAQPACPVIGLARTRNAPIPAAVDVVARSDAELDLLRHAIARNPVAACLLVQVLRHNEFASVEQGLLVESLAYSTLQHGTEFIQWLTHRPAPRSLAHAAADAVVLLTRDGESMRITLNRPDKRNAFSAAMRDALCAALEVPLADTSVREVVISGAGPAFCAGGDLDEFGAARDPAIAHATRMTRSAAALLDRLHDRVICHVHGACIGAGIELPAFTRRVHARADAYFQLPEVSLGLIPGAGGTVSITKRIGRLRTAQLALSGARIDAPMALSWGLVDAIVESFD